MAGVGVDGAADGMPVFEVLQVADHEVRLESVALRGHHRPGGGTQPGGPGYDHAEDRRPYRPAGALKFSISFSSVLGPVVVVVVDDADSAAEALFDVGGEGGLAAAGSSGE